MSVEKFNRLPSLANEDFLDNGNLVRRNGKDIVMFYADYCGFCRDLKPLYVEAAYALRNKARFHKVDLQSLSPELQRRLRNFKYEIKGIPALYGFTNGSQPVLFNRPKTIEAISAFIDEIPQSGDQQRQQRPRYSRSSTTPYSSTTSSKTPKRVSTTLKRVTKTNNKPNLMTRSMTAANNRLLK